MELEMWLKHGVCRYENIAVHAHCLIIVSKDPKGLVRALTNEHEFKLKGTGPMPCHLGCDFGRDDDGPLQFAPHKRIEKIIDCHFNAFGSKCELNVVPSL